MPKFSQSAVIHAPVEKLFAILSDPSQIPSWRNDVPGISNIKGSGNGTTFTEDVNFMGKKKLQMKITEYKPGKKLTITAEGGMSILPTQSFTLSPTTEGTHLTLDVDLKITGPLKIMAPLFPAQFKKIWAKYFVNLNSYLNR
ncbi:MAG: SRPBCC family protein [Ignavibacteriota bacterium]